MTFQLLAYKCRVYPNKEQLNLLEDTSQRCQVLYNKLLHQYQKDFKRYKIFNKREYLKSKINIYRDFPYFEDLEYSTLINTQNKLLRALNSKENPDDIRFKTMDSLIKSFYVKDRNVYIMDNVLHTSHYGDFKLHCGYNINSLDIKSYQFKQVNNKWFIIILTQSKSIPYFKKTGKKIGIDLGIKDLMIFSDGTKIKPLNINSINKKIIKLNKMLSRKEYMSNNYKKLLIEYHNAHEDRKNIIHDFYHKLSTNIVKEYDFIAMEHLDIQDMKKDHKFSKYIQQIDWYILVQMIKYKCKIHGKKFVQISTRFPSTKLCHVCGYKNTNMTINTRNWTCPRSNTHHDRDVNAAKNILNEALRKYPL